MSLGFPEQAVTFVATVVETNAREQEWLDLLRTTV